MAASILSLESRVLRHRYFTCAEVMGDCVWCLRKASARPRPTQAAVWLARRRTTPLGRRQITISPYTIPAELSISKQTSESSSTSLRDYKDLFIKVSSSSFRYVYFSCRMADKKWEGFDNSSSCVSFSTSQHEVSIIT